MDYKALVKKNIEDAKVLSLLLEITIFFYETRDNRINYVHLLVDIRG